MDKRTLAAFIENAQAEIAALNIRIAEAEDALRDLRSERQGVQREFSAFRSAYERLFNEEAPSGGAPDADEPDIFGFTSPRSEVYVLQTKSPTPTLDLGIREPETPADDWRDVGRSAAVLMAVHELLNDGHAYASPADIEALLRSKGREGDTRDYIGAALAYLNRSGQVDNVGRGQWVLSRQGEADTS
jgi:hypothetical protein